MIAMGANTESRLEELESRLAFQEDLIENLNEVVARQDCELSKLTLQLNTLKEKLADIENSTAVGGTFSGHEVPPHY
jgi:SlyX protein